MPHRHAVGPTHGVAPETRAALDLLIWAGAASAEVWRGYNRARKAVKLAAHVAADPAWTPKAVAALHGQRHLADQLCALVGVRPGLSPTTLATVIALAWGGEAPEAPVEERTPCLACGSQDDDVMPRPVDHRAVAPLCARCGESPEVLTGLSVDA